MAKMKSMSSPYTCVAFCSGVLLFLAVAAESQTNCRYCPGETEETLCESSGCPRYPDATCYADVCACKVTYYNSDGSGIITNCSKLCTEKKPYTHCYHDPCGAHWSCPNYSNAGCVREYCGGCSGQAYELNVHYTYEQCHEYHEYPYPMPEDYYHYQTPSTGKGKEKGKDKGQVYDILKRIVRTSRDYLHK